MRPAHAVRILFAGLLLAASPAPAHHSFKAEYDQDHPVKLVGIVTKVTWKNPHVHPPENPTMARQTVSTERRRVLETAKGAIRYGYAFGLQILKT